MQSTQMKRALLIDDIRNEDHLGLDTAHPTEDVIIVRNYEMGIIALQNMWPIDILYLDHDLGEGKDGYEIIKWLEEKAFFGAIHLIPKEMICVSSNSAGILKINDGWKAIQKRLKSQNL
jgi:hypothetical protein